MFDYLFEVNSADMPEEESQVQLIFERALLPLTLEMDSTGALYHAGAVLDDRALQALLLRFFGPAYTGLRALQVNVDRSCNREFDVQARQRILEQAVAAQVWVVPIFVPKDTETPD